MRFYLLLSIFLFFPLSCIGQYTVSDDLYNSLPDSIKTKNKKVNSGIELLKTFRYSLNYLRNYNELSGMASFIEKDIPNLKTKNDSIKVFNSLIAYYQNHTSLFNKSEKYANIVISRVGDNFKGYESSVSNAYMVLANIASLQKEYVKAINMANKSLSVTENTNINPIVKASPYLVLDINYSLIHLYSKAHESLNKAITILKKSDENLYNNLLRDYIDNRKLILAFIEYFDSKDLNLLSKIKQEIALKDTTGVANKWKAKLFSQKAFVNYFEKKFNTAQENLSIARNLLPEKNDLLGSMDALEGLLFIKTGEEKKGIKILESSKNLSEFELYSDLVLNELYNYYKNNNNLQKANLYLEKILRSNREKNNYKHQGLVFEANNKYNVFKKEQEIKLLETDSQLKISKALSWVFGLLLAVVILGAILMIKNRQNKIMLLNKEQEYLSNIQKMQDFLVKEEERMTNNIINITKAQKKEIGENIHNDLLGNIVALDFLMKDYVDMATEETEKVKLQDIHNEVKNIYTDFRNYSHVLSDDSIEGQSVNILQYIQEIQKRFNEIGVLKINTNIDNRVIREMSSKLQTEVYYLIKETFSNILKHSNATVINIAISLKNTFGIISIKDNGIGFKDNTFLSSGTGLKNLKERIVNLNGVMEIHTINGVEILVKLPINLV